jgi:hypothetical protein
MSTNNSTGKIYTGVWTNWSKGKVLGTTLTTTQHNGAILIAVIALFIAYVSRRLWRILCFAIHHLRSRASKSAQDGLYHQTQVVLRNSRDASTALWTWIQMAWYWHNTARILRTTPLILFAIFTLAWTAIAGIFSSRIASLSGQEALLVGDRCVSGMVSHLSQMGSVISPKQSLHIHAGSTYAKNCYPTSPLDAKMCGSYVKTRLQFSVNRNASCPFKDDICLHPSENIRFDTGYINTHDDLGINTPPEDRFEIRLVDHCAPLVISGHKAEVNVTLREGYVVPYARYYYGRRERQNTNYTYEYLYKLPSQRIEKQGLTAWSDYTIR